MSYLRGQRKLFEGEGTEGVILGDRESYLRGQRELFEGEGTEGVILGDRGSYLNGRMELFEVEVMDGCNLKFPIVALQKNFCSSKKTDMARRRSKIKFSSFRVTEDHT